MIKILDNYIAKLETNIPNLGNQKPGISQANIGWHIEHSLLTIDGVIERLKQTNINNYKWKPSFLRIIVFISKTIPRGRSKSPEVVRPKGDVSVESLSNHIIKTRQKIAELATINKNQFFEHPYFGHLKLYQAVTFLEIHTNHHLKIIRDLIE